MRYLLEGLRLLQSVTGVMKFIMAEAVVVEFVGYGSISMSDEHEVEIRPELYVLTYEKIPFFFELPSVDCLCERLPESA